MAQPELDEWTRRLLEAYEIPGASVDVDRILGLAGEAAHTVVRPAAPLTTFIAGYAAGLAAGHGMAAEADCVDSALRLARTVIARRAQEDAGAPAPAPGDDAR